MSVTLALKILIFPLLLLVFVLATLNVLTSICDALTVTGYFLWLKTTSINVFDSLQCLVCNILQIEGKAVP